MDRPVNVIDERVSLIERIRTGVNNFLAATALNAQFPGDLVDGFEDPAANSVSPPAVVLPPPPRNDALTRALRRQGDKDTDKGQFPVENPIYLSKREHRTRL
jgi:hypothetical protein